MFRNSGILHIDNLVSFVWRPYATAPKKVSACDFYGKNIARTFIGNRHSLKEITLVQMTILHPHTLVAMVESYLARSSNHFYTAIYHPDRVARQFSFNQVSTSPEFSPVDVHTALRSMLFENIRDLYHELQYIFIPSKIYTGTVAQQWLELWNTTLPFHHFVVRIPPCTLRCHLYTKAMCIFISSRRT